MNYYIEDKLNKLWDIALHRYEPAIRKEAIQAIITTETKKARIEAIASYKKVLKLEETALAETDRYDLLSNKQRKQLVDYHTNCLAALQKQQKQ